MPSEDVTTLPFLVSLRSGTRTGRPERRQERSLGVDFHCVSELEGGTGVQPQRPHTLTAQAVELGPGSQQHHRGLLEKRLIPGRRQGLRRRNLEHLVTPGGRKRPKTSGLSHKGSGASSKTALPAKDEHSDRQQG